jgi:hypothetical protein
MRHMRFHQMSRSESSIQTQFARKHSGSNDARKLAGVVTWMGGVWATDTKEIEHCGLGFEDGAPAESADFDGGHGD